MILSVAFGDTAAAHDIESTAGTSAPWSTEPGLWLALLLTAGLYALGIRKLWRRSTGGRPIRARQTVAFAAGWLALALCLVSPLDTFSSDLFAIHMIQHEVLMLIAAPLLVLGRPLPVFLWGLPAPARGVFSRLGQRSWVQHIWRELTRPLTAWFLHAITLWVWHTPQFFDAALTNRTLHNIQHIAFIVTALMFWSALLNTRARESMGAAVLYLFTTTIHSGVLGALITFAQRPWYPSYLETTHRWGLSPLEDQQLGGLIMWVPGAMVYVAFGLYLMALWIEGRGVGQAFRE